MQGTENINLIYKRYCVDGGGLFQSWGGGFWKAVWQDALLWSDVLYTKYALYC